MLLGQEQRSRGAPGGLPLLVVDDFGDQHWLPCIPHQSPPVSQREPSTDVVRDSGLGLDPPHLTPQLLLALTTPLDPSLLEQLAVLLLRHTFATLLDD
jgi:hypothetical protein